MAIIWTFCDCQVYITIVHFILFHTVLHDMIIGRFTEKGGRLYV